MNLHHQRTMTLLYMLKYLIPMASLTVTAKQDRAQTRPYNILNNTAERFIRSLKKYHKGWKPKLLIGNNIGFWSRRRTGTWNWQHLWDGCCVLGMRRNPGGYRGCSGEWNKPKRGYPEKRLCGFWRDWTEHPHKLGLGRGEFFWWRQHENLRKLGV